MPEMRGKLTRDESGWRCDCPGTAPGRGATPESAWLAWADALKRSHYLRDEPRDAYDQTELDYRRMG